ncbi:MAG: malonyl-[acyl-carrier protein] O-methyltransferase BioC [Desulfobulbus propionicus]|nr:MAG: malonyl-[acyl-carrier protein] O-methyltransferase BioC [Desulfobulbus propionicus]
MYLTDSRSSAATNTMFPDKKLIEQRFAKAALTYEKQAGIQHSVAKKLLKMIDSQLKKEPASILEIGCCTGLLTSYLVQRFPQLHTLLVTDLSPSFKPFIEEKTKQLNGAVSFLSGDIETIDIHGTYDVIISSSTLHWIYDLPALFSKLHTLLKTESILAFSIYGTKNVQEIKSITGIGLNYLNMAHLQDAISSKFEILDSDQALEQAWFSSPMEVLQHLRQTGVNALGSKAWTRRDLKRFIDQYTCRFSGEKGVSLTYHPMYFVAQPRP